MFERFTDRARKAMQFANQEAQRFNHEYVGTEHVLLGLLREEDGNAAKVLANLGLKLDGVRSDVIAILSSPAGETTRKFTFTDGDAVSLMVELVTCGGDQGQVLTRWLKRTIEAVDGKVTKGASDE